jgi:hypothetical protein
VPAESHTDIIVPAREVGEGPDDMLLPRYRSSIWATTQAMQHSNITASSSMHQPTSVEALKVHPLEIASCITASFCPIPFPRHPRRSSRELSNTSPQRVFACSSRTFL